MSESKATIGDQMIRINMTDQSVKIEPYPEAWKLLSSPLASTSTTTRSKNVSPGSSLFEEWSTAADAPASSDSSCAACICRLSACDQGCALRTLR